MKVNQLHAGAGAAPICFKQEMFPTEGFCGIHDDPFLKVLLLDCGEKVAIVSVEIVMLPGELIDQVKKTIGEITNTKEENIWIHVTHAITTPHAPHAPMGMGGVKLEISEEEKKELDCKIAMYNDSIMASAVKAAQVAADSLRPAKMGMGAGECAVNINRDVPTPHGWWINFNPDGPSNHTATILRFDDLDGKPIGAMISYGLKPCGIDNSEMEKNTRLVSSDVPGLACTLLEEKLGAPCLFAMSAAGDQVPLEQAWYDVVEEDGTVRKVDIGVQAGLEIVDRLGRKMAQDLEPVLEQIVCDQDTAEIALDQSFIEWAGKGRGKMQPTLKAEYEAKGTQRVDVMAMTVGDIALVAVKPEINTPTEEQLQKASPYQNTLVVSMVNGGQKYMPHREAYENSTWEAQSAPLMPGAAEAWVDEAVKVLNRMKKA